MALELLLAAHDRNCLTCTKSGACKLQDYAERYGIDQVRFINPTDDAKKPLDESNPALVRDPNKCILCGNCVRVCYEHQGMHVLDFAYRGSEVEVGPAFGKTLADVDCVYCGQCASVCPTGAITVRQDIETVRRALNDPAQTVVFQVAPAVRVSLGEAFGLPPGTNIEGKIVAALRRMGAKKVFDTNFAADLTIMEEATEFLHRLKAGEKLPLFTSCCPAWVKTAEQSHPDLLPNLSSCRSPQQMFGSMVKNYYVGTFGTPPDRVFCVSVMPCTAKKFEAARPEFAYDGMRDVDAVLTTQELARMIRAHGLDLASLPDEAFDRPFGESTGAAAIFGASGGVAEAAVRTAYHQLTGEELPRAAWESVPAEDGVRETTLEIAGQPIHLAMVSGLANATALIEKVRRGERHYHLVEVMACPGGCVGGGGQPAHDSLEKRAARARGLSAIDHDHACRQSHQNTEVRRLYGNVLETPGSAIAHMALHTAYTNRRRIEESILLEAGGPLTVEVCVGTCCYQQGAYESMRKLGRLLRTHELDGQVELRATFCFEQCQQGPNLAVNGRVLGNATPERIGEIFATEILPALQDDGDCPVNPDREAPATRTGCATCAGCGAHTPA
jgi:NADH-quinone oxidoreductase subunit G